MLNKRYVMCSGPVDHLSVESDLFPTGLRVKVGVLGSWGVRVVMAAL